MTTFSTIENKLVVIALIAMTVFFRTELGKKTTDDGSIYFGALFFGITTILFNGLAKNALTIAKLPTFYKQRDLLFFPSWAYALPNWLLKIPVSFIDVGIWLFTTYYVMGFDPNVGRLYKQYLLLLLLHQMASGLFRFVASMGRSMIVSNTFGAFAMVTILSLGGFVLARENVKKWWIWGYWISPLMYVTNAISVNEFFGRSWRKFDTNSNESLGVQVMKMRGIFPDSYWYWIGVGALFGYTILFNGFYSLALDKLSLYKKSQSAFPDESPKEEVNIANIVQGVEQASRGRSTSTNMPPEMKAQGVPEDRLMLLKGVSGAFRPGVLKH